MARLPNPGSDDGTWGTILNDFLSQAHNTDGTLKADAVTTGAVADANITEAKLSSAVQTKLNNTAPVTSVNSYTGAVTLAKSDVGLGNVDNTSDASKPVSTATQTALNLKANDSAVVHNTGPETVAGVKTFTSSPVVPSPSSGTDAANMTYVDTGLAGKAATVHTHAAADVTSGTLDINRIPTGTTGTTVALGNHAHTGTYLPIKNGTVSITDSTNDKFARVDITDDASATSGWPDRLAFYFSGTRTGYHNEYGELRARPAKNNTVALRAMYFGSGSANIFEVSPSASGVDYFSVSSTAASLTVPLSSTQNISTTGTVTGSNIGAKVTASSSAPSSPATGDVWIDLSA